MRMQIKMRTLSASSNICFQTVTHFCSFHLSEIGLIACAKWFDPAPDPFRGKDWVGKENCF